MINCDRRNRNKNMEWINEGEGKNRWCWGGCNEHNDFPKSEKYHQN